MTCEQCGGPVKKQGRKFCSYACYGVSQRTRPTASCERCGAPFKQRADGTARFCGRACYDAARIQTITKACPVCRQDFTVPAVIADRYQVCSLECRWAGSEYADCPTCGKRFSTKRGVQKHCSEACRRPPTMVACLECGEVFRRVPSATNHRFCSVACYRRSKAPTLPELRVGQALDRLGYLYRREYRVGRYSLDFAVPDVLFDLEIDGAYWHDPEKDARRDAALEALGWTIVRLADTVIASLSDETLQGVLAHDFGMYGVALLDIQ